MQLKTDQERVSSLLKETITLMCKNGLKFDSKFCIDAVIGVTLDEKEVFLISLNEVVKSESPVISDSASETTDGEMSAGIPRKKRKRNKPVKKERDSNDDTESEYDDNTSLPSKRLSVERTDSNQLEQDSNDDSAIMFIKEEPNSSWQESSPGSYPNQNTSVSASQINFPAFSSPALDSSNFSLHQSSFASDRTGSSLMGRPSPSQLMSPYHTTSGPLTAVHGQGMAYTQAQDQVRTFIIGYHQGPSAMKKIKIPSKMCIKMVTTPIMAMNKQQNSSCDPSNHRTPLF
jgi:hypothetical protein